MGTSVHPRFQMFRQGLSGLFGRRKGAELPPLGMATGRQGCLPGVKASLRVKLSLRTGWASSSGPKAGLLGAALPLRQRWEKVAKLFCDFSSCFN